MGTLRQPEKADMLTHCIPHVGNSADTIPAREIKEGRFGAFKRIFIASAFYDLSFAVHGGWNAAH